MKKLLLVIDVQKEFINEYTGGVLNRIKKLINSKEYDIVAFTRFINDEKSVFYKKLKYRGCMNLEQQEIAIETGKWRVFNKRTYTVVNEEFKNYIKDNKIDEIYICGFDTDACVQKTALDLFEQEYNVFILKDYCMCYRGYELHEATINNLKRLIGRDSII